TLSQGAGLQVNDGTPTFDHITLSHLSGSALSVSGSTATPVVSFATFDTNTWGISLASGAGVNVTDSTLTGSTSAAISVEAGTRLLGLTNIIATGNGSDNAVLYRGGTINGTETWRSGMPWLVTTQYGYYPPSVSTSGNLIIEAGTTVEADTPLAVSGK